MLDGIYRLFVVGRGDGEVGRESPVPGSLVEIVGTSDTVSV